MQKFLDEVQTMAGHFTTFLEGATIALLESAFGSSMATLGSSESITPKLRFEDVSVPFFYDHGLSDRDA